MDVEMGDAAGFDIDIDAGGIQTTAQPQQQQVSRASRVTLSVLI